MEDFAPGQGRLAAINSFGYGGTNAHVVLERAPAGEATQVQEGQGPWLLPLSARANTALAEFALALARQVEDSPAASLEAFGHALAVRRVHHDYRAVVIARDRQHFVEQLRLLAAGGLDPTLRTGHAVEGGRIAWVYAGMGAQWWGMGRDLFRKSEVFREAILSCDQAWRRAGGNDRLQAMFDPSYEIPEPLGDPMIEPHHSQPANLALQVGLTTVLRSLGMEADAIVGRSVGEVGAAWAARVLSLESAFLLTFHRARLQQERLGLGAMLSLSIGAAPARKRILELTPDVEIAAFNDDDSVTLGGAEEDLDRIAAWANEHGVKSQRLRVGVAYHTVQMEPLRDRFVSAIAGIQYAAPQLPLYSTVTGARIDDGELTAEYWWKNVRQPVLLTAALSQLRQDGLTGFLEVGPHPVLAGSILPKVPGAVSWPTQRRGFTELSTLLMSVGDSYCFGKALDWERLYPHGSSDLRTPRYPFQRQTLWEETPESHADRLVEELHPLLHERLLAPQPVWQTTLNELFLPWLREHKISDVPVFPGAAYAVAALAAAEQAGRGNSVEDLTFQRALETRSQTSLRIELDPRDGCVTFSSLAPEQGAEWRMHATGRLPAARFAAGAPLDLVHIRSRCKVEMEVEGIYRQLAAQGLQYGPAFRCIEAVRIGSEEALVALRCRDPESSRYLLHPGLLDATLQATLPIAFREMPVGAYIPVQIQGLRLFSPVPERAIAFVKLTRKNSSSFVAEINLVDSDGRRLADVEGVRFQRLTTGQGEEAANGLLYAWTWEPAEVSSQAGLPEKGEPWLLIARDWELATALCTTRRSVAAPGLTLISETELATRLANRRHGRALPTFADSTSIP